MSSIDVIVPARPRRIASSALREVLWAVCIFAVVSLFASAYLSICTEVPEGYWQAPWLAPSVICVPISRSTRAHEPFTAPPGATTRAAWFSRARTWAATTRSTS